MDRIFEKYEIYKYDENGNICDCNAESFNNSEEAFELFKKLYNTDYGSIYEDENLIAIHTGGWSDNEGLIADFKLTAWWFKYHKITCVGGHYYFNTDTSQNKEWRIVKFNESGYVPPKVNVKDL